MVKEVVARRNVAEHPPNPRFAFVQKRGSHRGHREQEEIPEARIEKTE
jgi:hypothetical protein